MVLPSSIFYITFSEALPANRQANEQFNSSDRILNFPDPFSLGSSNLLSLLLDTCFLTSHKTLEDIGTDELEQRKLGKEGRRKIGRGAKTGETAVKPAQKLAVIRRRK